MPQVRDQLTIPSPAQLSVTEYVVPVWARYGSFLGRLRFSFRHALCAVLDVI